MLPATPRIPLTEYLALYAETPVPLGAKLRAVQFAPLTLHFLIVGQSYEVITILAHDVEDWHPAPDHNLLEGLNTLTLTTEDSEQLRAHLESIAPDGLRDEFPERCFRLRHGESWILAAEFGVQRIPDA